MAVKYENGIDYPEVVHDPENKTREAIAGGVMTAVAVEALKEEGESYADGAIRGGILAMIFIGIGMLFMPKDMPAEEAVEKVTKFWCAVLFILCFGGVFIIGFIDWVFHRMKMAGMLN